MPWYLSPTKLWRTARGVHRIVQGGGPARVRLDGIEGPNGWILPSLAFDLDIQARDGETVALDPELPVPTPWGVGWKLARMAGVPVIRDVDPGRVRFELPVPALPVLSDRAPAAEPQPVDRPVEPAA